jgi:sugar phosphate isomerase/epimerase
MSPTTRREFLGTAALVGAALRPGLAASATRRTPAGGRMTMDLVCGAIGIEASQREAIELAGRHGFESVGADGSALQGLSESELGELRGLLKDHGLVWGAAGLAVDFRGDDETFRRTSEGLGRFAAGLRRAGVSRVGTWLTPASDTLTYRKNFAVVASRLRETASALQGEGLRLGLEYVGPKTSWASRKYPFIHTLAETAELVEAIGVPGVGYVLDSWHWYLAGDTADQIRALRNEDVVAVDLNDAPAGIPKDEQMDLSRELPMATGIIPVAEFLGALRDIGYDGPVRAEPFKQAVNAMGNEEAAAAAAEALGKALALVR